MSEHQLIVGDHVHLSASDIEQLERLADWKEALELKIERARWCINLLLLDGLDRDELEQLKSEVNAFHWACLAWRQPNA
jgi:hypothetical protein